MAGAVSVERQAEALGGTPLSKWTVAAAWLAFFFLIMPSLIVIPMSFGDINEIYFPPRSLSLVLYKEYFFESTWMETTLQSFRVGIISKILFLFFGTTAAYGVVRSDFPGKKLFALGLLSPMFMPHIVTALGLYIYLSLLHLQGTTASLIMGHTLLITPFVMVIVMAGLRGVDPNLESAARIMGAGRIYTFRKVTLPLLTPSLVVASLITFLLSFDELIIAVFLSGFGTTTLPVKMYENVTEEVSPVLAAISVLLTLLDLVICVSITMLQKAKSQEETR